MMSRKGRRSSDQFYYDRSRPASEYVSLNSRSLLSRNDPRSPDELTLLTAQLESERKLRKDTDERCRQLLLKIEHMQAILNLRNEALEKEKAARQEAEHMCQSLQTTIDKLEQYLKTRNTTEDQQIISHSNVNNISLSQITRLQGELQIRDEQDEKFQKKAKLKEPIHPRTVPVAALVHTTDVLNQRCKSPKFRDFQDNEVEF